MEVNVYDFDGTIYRYDSTLKFYIFCLKMNPLIIRFLFIQIKGFIKYKFKLCSKKEYKECFFSFLCGIHKVDDMVAFFWKKEKENIAEWYFDVLNSNDIIISASPEFLVKPLCLLLNIKNVIATKVDKKTGKFTSENCYGVEKVNRFNKEYNGYRINNFYSDSVSDLPIAELAKSKFLIVKGVPTKWV